MKLVVSLAAIDQLGSSVAFFGETRRPVDTLDGFLYQVVASSQGSDGHMSMTKA